MLWDSVFEFFIKYVFGGMVLDGEAITFYRGVCGLGVEGSNYSPLDTSNLLAVDMPTIFGGTYKYPFGNYLSLIATIITMVIIVYLCALFIWKIVKLLGGLIR